MSILQDEKAINKSPSGRFLKFDEELEKGTFKTVYRGLDTETGNAVAWCELEEDKFNEQELQKFKNEMSMLVKLEHSNIEKFYDYWENHDVGKSKCIVLITELMTSGTLKLYIEKFKTLDMKIIKYWSRQILRGLNFLHTRNPPIIHRNLKCDNIFVLAATGNVKIGNFGLSTYNNMTLANCSIGTLEFIAPELYDENYDESVDVYAFGMCLLEMVTGEYPYSECNFPIQVYKKVTAGIKPDCFSKIPNKYSEVKDIIDRCIRVNKEERMTVGQLMAHDFFVSDDQYSVKIELKNKEDLLKNSSPSQIELDVTTGVEGETENKLNESDKLQFFSDYVDDRIENLMDRSMEKPHVPENDKQITKENEEEKILEINDEISSGSTSSFYGSEKTNNNVNVLTQNNINLTTTDNCITNKCDNQTVKKGRFDVKPVNIAPSVADQNSKLLDIPHGVLENTEIGSGILANQENIDISLYQSIENNNIVGKSIGMSKSDLASQIFTEPLSHQNHHQSELGGGRSTQSLSDEQINMLNGQIGKDLMTPVSLQHAINKNTTDFSYQQFEESVKISKPLIDDQDIPLYSTTSTLPSNIENIIASHYNDKSSTLPHESPSNGNINLNSYIQNLESGLRKLSRACGITLNFDNIINNQVSTVPENVLNCQNTSKSFCNAILKNGSTNLVQSQLNQTESHSGMNVEELKYLLEMTQKQIALQQQMLMAVVENKASKSIEQSILSKEDFNIGNYCGNNQILDNMIQQKYITSIEDNVLQSQNRKVLLNTLSEKLTTTTTNNNNGQTYQHSDNLPHSQGPSQNFGGRGCIDEVDKKLDSTNQGQKTCNDTIPITLNNVRKNSVTHVYDDKKKESTVSNPSLYYNTNNMDGINSILNIQTSEKTNNSSKDCTRKNSVDLSNEEVLKKLSSNNGNLVNLLSQEVEDVLSYQKSNGSMKNLSSAVCKNFTYSCHSPEYHSIIDADLDVIEKESELYKIDKLVFRTLERHKKELLELRNRQCTELREIKHLTSLMALKTQELINAIKSRK